MVTFTLKRFDELTLHELYALLALRSEVFVVEQQCPYQDADGKDAVAWHCLGTDETGKLVAYTRLFALNDSFEGYTSIGRVVTSPSARGGGLGRKLMETSIALCHSLFGPEPIKIGAQQYLLAFYSSLGFEPTGHDYIEDGIPHTYMIYR